MSSTSEESTASVKLLAVLGKKLSPPTDTWIREPGFGEAKLTPQQLEKFCELLANTMDMSKNAPYIPAIVCYALNCSGADWEDFRGQIRSILYFSTQEDCAQLPVGYKMFQIGPRKTIWTDIIRPKWVIEPLREMFPFLTAYDTQDLPHATAWIKRMIVNHITQEMSWLNSNYDAIEKGTVCRSDQIDSMKWTGAKLGKASTFRAYDVSTLTDFDQTMLATTNKSLADRSSEVARPKVVSKRKIESCHLVITRCISFQPPNTQDGETPPVELLPVENSRSIKLTELREAAAEVEREAEASAAGDTSSAPTTRKTTGFPIEFLLQTCNKEFRMEEADGYVIAWQNPLTFFGARNVLCAIRTPSEFELVLEELKKIHLLSNDDDRLFLFFVEKSLCADEKQMRKKDDVVTSTRTPTATSQAQRAASKRMLPKDGEVGRGQGKKRKTYTPSPAGTPSP